LQLPAEVGVRADYVRPYSQYLYETKKESPMPYSSDDRQRTRLAELTAQGLSARQIAKQMRLSITRVYYLVKVYGLTLSKGPRGGHRRGNSVSQKLAPYTDAEVRELLTQHGNSLAGLARHLGVSKGGVFCALARRGIRSTNPKGVPYHLRQRLGR
jgi:transposase